VLLAIACALCATALLSGLASRFGTISAARALHSSHIHETAHNCILAILSN
jgi:hypothetical protein